MNWNFINIFLLSIQLTAPEKTVGHMACDSAPFMFRKENSSLESFKTQEKTFTYPRVTQTGVDESIKQTFNIACTCIFFDMVVLDR